MMTSFKLQKVNHRDHLNTIGMILFSLVSVAFVSINPLLIPEKMIQTTMYLTLFLIGTTNLKNVTFTYSFKNPMLVFVSNKVLLKHFISLVSKSHLKQMILFIFFSAIFFYITHDYYIIIISFVSTCIFVFSNIAYNILNFIIKIICYLHFFVYHNLEVLIMIYILQIFLIFLSVYLSKRVNMFFLGINHSNKSNVNNTIFSLLLTYINKNFILISLVGIFVAIISFISQDIMYQASQLPGLLVIVINFLIVLEVLVTNNKDTILIGKSRLELLSSLQTKSLYVRFKNSSIYLITLVIIIFNIFGFVGTLFQEISFKMIIQNLITFPLTVFFGFIYFRKSELLVQNHSSIYIKLTLPILFFVSIIIYLII